MEGIFFKDGVYVLCPENYKNEFCILATTNKLSPSLYGGRVKIRNAKLYNSSGSTAQISVDGISIILLDKQYQSKDKMVITYDLPLSTVISILNAIETNGVDAFLEHYKKSIEFLYAELIELERKTESNLLTEQDESIIKKLLEKLNAIRDVFVSVLIILFSLNLYMSAGLENEKVISVSQSIIDSFV